MLSLVWKAVRTKVSVYNVKYLGEAVKQTNKQNRKIVYKIENNLNFWSKSKNKVYLELFYSIRSIYFIWIQDRSKSNSPINFDLLI